jgi:signal transduction histidine kinase
LYISKYIVESHHGQLEVRSTVGQGSTFIVCLPVVPPARSTGQLMGDGK